MSNFRIVFSNADGGVSIIVPAPGVTQADAAKAVPPGAAYEIVDANDIPADRTFRNAWFHDTTPEPRKIGVSMDKAKGVAHERRRAKRAAEFAPLDVEATIPAKAASAEAARQAIRDKHAQIQADIDAATTVDELKTVMADGAI